MCGNSNDSPVVIVSIANRQMQELHTPTVWPIGTLKITTGLWHL